MNFTLCLSECVLRVFVVCLCIVCVCVCVRVCVRVCECGCYFLLKNYE